jgi:hypothetical protein
VTAPNKLTDRAAELANQAVVAAGPALARAREVAGDLAVKAGPYVGRAAGLAAQGVAVTADQLDKATSGRYSSRISSLATKIEQTLDRAKQ